MRKMSNRLPSGGEVGPSPGPEAGAGGRGLDGPRVVAHGGVLCLRGVGLAGSEAQIVAIESMKRTAFCSMSAGKSGDRHRRKGYGSRVECPPWAGTRRQDRCGSLVSASVKSWQDLVKVSCRSVVRQGSGRVFPGWRLGPHLLTRSIAARAPSMSPWTAAFSFGIARATRTVGKTIP